MFVFNFILGLMKKKQQIAQGFTLSTYVNIGEPKGLFCGPPNNPYYLVSTGATLLNIRPTIYLCRWYVDFNDLSRVHVRFNMAGVELGMRACKAENLKPFTQRSKYKTCSFSDLCSSFLSQNLNIIYCILSFFFAFIQ